VAKTWGFGPVMSEAAEIDSQSKCACRQRRIIYCASCTGTNSTVVITVLLLLVQRNNALPS
jgi:hypothetical protein